VDNLPSLALIVWIALFYCLACFEVQLDFSIELLVEMFE